MDNDDDWQVKSHDDPSLLSDEAKLQRHERAVWRQAIAREQKADATRRKQEIEAELDCCARSGDKAKIEALRFALKGETLAAERADEEILRLEGEINKWEAARPLTEWDERILRELAQLGTDEDAPEPEPELDASSQRPRGEAVQFKDPDPDDPNIIFDEIKPTRYDKARQRLQEIKAVEDGLGDEASPATRAALQRQREEAEKKLAFAQSDIARWWGAIDGHRETPEGRKKRNDKRRTVRDKPNANLKEMTPEQKEHHKKRQSYIRGVRFQLTERGWSAEDIEKELVVRLLKWDAKKEREAKMRDDPNFGAF